MIDFRSRHPAVHRSRFFDGKVNDRGLPDVSWHGCQLLHPGWDDPNARALAFTLAGFGTEADIHVMLNMDSEGLDFEIPGREGPAVASGRRHGGTVAARHRRAGPGAADRRRAASTSKAAAWSSCCRDRTASR